MVSRKTLVWVVLAWCLAVSEARADLLTSSGGWLSWGAANTESGSSGPLPGPIAPTPAAAPPAPAAVSQAQVTSAPATTAPPPAGGVYNAFVNLGVGPYPNADGITSGNAQAWYNSAPVASLFGGHPTSQQQTDFANTVIQRIEQTFQHSGVNVSLTDTPGHAAAHTLSLVSNTSAQLLPSAIGMTFVGGNGFSFVDQEANVAQNVDQLESIVAHNISHELMLAFGVGENYDKSGNYIDARNANFSMMTSSSATFSSDAAKALNQALTQDPSNTTAGQFAQVVDAKPVPEPTTLALWSLAATAAIVARRRRNQRLARPDLAFRANRLPFERNLEDVLRPPVFPPSTSPSTLSTTPVLNEAAHVPKSLVTQIVRCKLRQESSLRPRSGSHQQFPEAHPGFRAVGAVRSAQTISQ